MPISFELVEAPEQIVAESGVACDGVDLASGAAHRPVAT